MICESTPDLILPPCFPLARCGAIVRFPCPVGNGEHEVLAWRNGGSQCGRNLYLPIPYAKHYKITYDRNWWTDGRKPDDRAFYLINYRSYAAGTQVETFSNERLAAAKSAIAKVQEMLLEPEKAAPVGGSAVDPVSQSLKAGKRMTLTLPDGPRAIGRFSLQLEAEDMADALRSTVLAISFDGKSGATRNLPLDTDALWVPGKKK